MKTVQLISYVFAFAAAASFIFLIAVIAAHAQPLARPADCSRWDSYREACLEYSPASLEPPARDPAPAPYRGVRASDIEGDYAWGTVELLNPHAPKAAPPAPAAASAP